ncbi:uncharacterized protein LOC115033830 [Acyrthosiphon pisum]|uniref:ATP-dependent DNA helicase n=1 Tax=Acyrthosiphon pisum TaxID=7029 RepID=A0A8R2JPP7_ACYPI|nr:uncharacterized protein LOC115033830 [Acyrthosiphon pisum]
MRAGNDAEFAAWLLQLGNGQMPSIDEIPDTIDIPPQLVCNVVDLTDFVYAQQMSLVNVDEFARRIILCPRNEDCHQMNSTVLRRVVRVERTYYAIDMVVVDDPDEAANYPTEFLNSMHPTGLPPFSNEADSITG